jgi:ABC-2 type transport system ATP-binding protein
MEEMNTRPAIEVVTLTKRYPAPLPLGGWRGGSARFGRDALTDVSFEVATGEVVALIGPNGSGKSTLLRILSGLLLPSSGRARVAQLDVVLDRPRSRQVIGVALSDDRGLAARLTVRQNLEFFSALYSVPAREAPGRILELAERLEAAPLLDRPVRTLSTGERARAVLIRTLLHKPRVLLLDELTRSLDPGAARRLRQQILADAAKEGVAVLFASHDLSEVQSIASRVVLLDHGRIAASGSYSDIQGVAGTVFAEAG